MKISKDFILGFVITLLIIKHFICDFPLQSNWMAFNKGIYGHLGGLAHSGVQIFGTFFCLIVFIQTTRIFFDPLAILSVLFVEFIIHYHMDWFKMWFNKKMGWKSDTSPEFWILLGVDQLVHYLTYVGMVWYLL